MMKRPQTWIGYSQHRNDLMLGQHANWETSRAFMVRADGSERREVGRELITRPHSWTQFAGWSPDGRKAIITSLWESPENAAWEHQNKTFRFSEGWLVDGNVLDLRTGKLLNVSAIDRVSNHNAVTFTPDGRKLLMTSVVKGSGRPFVMDLDGSHKRDAGGDSGGFAYGLNASPDGKYISYHEDYQVYIAHVDGSGRRKIDTGNPFNFVPQWSPKADALLFLSGEHYDCHPHIVRPDGSGLRKLADRGGYRGVVEFLKYPDFHSERSDIPCWSRDGRSVIYTAKVRDAVEVMRVDLNGKVRQLTHSQPGVRNYHPTESPDGRWLLFGSDRTGVMQLYVGDRDCRETWAITAAGEGNATLAGGWQPGKQ